MGFVKKLLAIVRTSIIDTLAYRGDILLFTLSSAVQSVVVLAVWLAVISSGGDAPLSRDEFIRYFLSLMLVGLWTSSWAGQFISNDIRLGKLSPFLLKPAPYFFIFHVGNNLGEKFLKSLYLLPILTILGLLLRISLPVLPIYNWILFIISWLLAAALTFLIDMSIGLTAFWLEESHGVGETYSFLYYFLSGRLIPLFVLPGWIQAPALLLPFRYQLSFPLEISLNKLSTGEIVNGLTLQIIYVAAAIIFLGFLWKRGLRKYSAVGA